MIKRAKVSYPSFYRHFASKEECFGAAVESLLARLAGRLNEDLAEDADQAARLICLAKLLAAAPATARVVAIEAEQLPRDSAPHFEARICQLLAGGDADPFAGPSPATAGARLTAPLTPRLDARLLLAGAFAELFRGAVFTGGLAQFPAEIAALTPQLAGADGQAARGSATESRRGLLPRTRERRGQDSRRTASTPTVGVSR